MYFMSSEFTWRMLFIEKELLLCHVLKAFSNLYDSYVEIIYCLVFLTTISPLVSVLGNGEVLA